MEKVCKITGGHGIFETTDLSYHCPIEEQAGGCVLKRLMIATTLIFISLGTRALLAGPVAETAAEAEAFALDGKPIDAILTMDAALGKLWNQLPLTFIEALFVQTRPEGYGVYTPHPSNSFTAGEDMLVYTELAGYGYGRDGDHYTIALDADMEVRTEDGKLLGGQQDFVELTHRSRVPSREFFAVLTYNFTGIAPGQYKVTTTLRDQNSDRVSSFGLTFEIE